MSASGNYSIRKSDLPPPPPRPPPPGRSSFAQTCNLLSQYVKGTKGAATGISGLLEPTAAKSESATMKLLSSKMEVSAPSADLATSNYTSSKEDGTGMEGERDQLTIFYGGKVFVFDDFPADRARQILLLAGDVAVAPPPVNGISPPPPPPSREGLHQQQFQANPSALPTARRSSLHRFLEKRKDRSIAGGPYHQHPIQNATDPCSSSKNEEQLELKL